MKHDTPLRAEQKKAFFEAGMEGDHVLAHLDSRAPGVSLPVSLQGNASLTLKFSYYFQGETTHDENGIIAYLRFGGQYSQCIVPWSAVWGLTTSKGDNRIWPEDIPREVMLQMARAKIASVGKKLFGVRSKSEPGPTGASNTATSSDPGAGPQSAPGITGNKRPPAKLEALKPTPGAKLCDQAATSENRSVDPTDPNPTDPKGGPAGGNKNPGLKRVK